MRLSEIQEQFKNIMLIPNYDSESFQNLCRRDQGISLENRLKVYRNNIIRSLTQVTMAALPMTKKLVGAQFLEQALWHYVVENLPTEGHLTLYGRSFPEFIKQYLPAQDIPYLYDFTNLEWAWEAAYYADDDVSLALEALQEVSEDQLPFLTFFKRHSVTLLESEFPLDDIVDFCRSDDLQDSFTLKNRGVKLMVFRPDLKVEIRKLTDSEYLFLKMLQEGHIIQDVAVTILEFDPNFNITEILQKHLSLGTFSGFDVKD